MLLFPFLRNRETGGIGKFIYHPTDKTINFDYHLSRLVNSSKDVYPSSIQDTDIPPLACKFREDKEMDLLAVSNEDGEILLIDTENQKVINSFTAHNNAIFDISWMPDKYQLITAAGDHRASLWDMNTCKLIKSYKGHLDCVKSVDVCKVDTAVFATGSKDGTICVWDRREESGQMYERPSIFINAAHDRKNRKNVSDKGKQGSAMGSVSNVVFQNNYQLISSGVADGVIKVWDLRKTYIFNRTYSARYQIKYANEGHGCSSLVFDSLYRKLYACTTTNAIYQFDCHAYSNDYVAYTGFKCNSYFIKLALSCDDQYLLCGSSDNKAYIWKTNNPGKPLLALPGHSAEVTSVTWSPYSVTKLVTSGDDNRILGWNVNELDNTRGDCENAALCPVIEDTEIPDEDSQNVKSHSDRTLGPSDCCKLSKTFFIKSIKSFFSPLSPSSTQAYSAGQLSNSESANHNQSASSEDAMLGVSSLSRSPCKPLNDNSGTLVTNESILGPLKSVLSGKENSVDPGTSTDSDTTFMNTNLKRKAISQEPLSTTIRNCGRIRARNRCIKKMKTVPEKNSIKTYFRAFTSPPKDT